MSRDQQLLVGAKAIAMHVFGSERRAKRVYSLIAELGLFYLGGQICGRPNTIEERLRSREAAAIATRT
jgi:hypothetical protein